MTDIKFVVNFDFPNNTEDYIHRIGRTARADQTGTAYSFFTSGNAKQARELIDILKEAKQNIPPRLYNMLELSKQIHMAKCELQSPCSVWLFILQFVFHCVLQPGSAIESVMRNAAMRIEALLMAQELLAEVLKVGQGQHRGPMEIVVTRTTWGGWASIVVRKKQPQ